MVSSKKSKREQTNKMATDKFGQGPVTVTGTQRRLKGRPSRTVVSKLFDGTSSQYKMWALPSQICMYAQTHVGMYIIQVLQCKNEYYKTKTT